MRSVRLAIVNLALAIGIVACAPATPLAAPTTTSTPLVAATEAAASASAPATAVPAASATQVSPTAALAATTTPAPSVAAPLPTTAVPAPTATTAPAATAPSGGGAGSTAGDLVQAGEQTFKASCSFCHGNQGEGVTAPALIGSASNLAKYKTGQGLYDKVQTTMPRTAPGSLSGKQYLELVVYLLVQNNVVDRGASVSQDTLGQIQIK